MQTPNTLHIQTCSVQGCASSALVTVAYGHNVTSVKGWCKDHVEYISALSPREQQQEEDNELLRSLGFTV